MATKKKAKVGTTKKKKSRMSGTKQGAADFFTNLLTVVATTLAVEYGDKLIPDSWDLRLVGGGKAVAGAALPFLSKDPKMKKHLLAVGNVLLSNGTKTTAKGFGVLSGDENGSDLYIAMSGEDLKIINGAFPGSDGNLIAGDDLTVINGGDEEDIE